MFIHRRASKPVLIEMSSYFWVAAGLAGAGEIHSPGLGRTPERCERGRPGCPEGFTAGVPSEYGLDGL